MTTTPQARRSRVIVGVDGSPTSILALQWAARLAPTLDADILAISVWSLAVSYEGYALADYDFEPETEKILADALEAAFGDQVPDRLQSSAREGQAAGVLIDESRDADMLVVGSRGHGGFAGLLLGSVSTQCAAHAHCPVLVVPKAMVPAE